MTKTHFKKTNHIGCFQHLREETPEATILIKKWIRNNHTLEKSKNQRRFLYQCKRRNIFPSNILNHTNINLNFHNPKSNDKINHFLNYFRYKLLLLLISDINFYIKQLNKNIQKLEYDITNTTSNSIVNNLKQYNIPKFKQYGKRLINKSLNNFKFLERKQITLPNFYNEKFVTNLSTKFIPNNVLEILSLGGNFAVPIIDKKDFPLQDFITSIECNRIKISNQDLNYLRSNLTFTIKKFLINQIIWDPNLKFLEHKIKETKLFIKNNDDLLITRSDKGNVTVIIERESYNEKINHLLNDNNIYETINNPTNSIINELNIMVDD